MSPTCQLYPTIITPFTPENKIDYPSLDRLIHYQLSNGCDGLFAVCQSSEMFYLDEAEKLELAAHCIRRCHEAGKYCVVSGHTQDALDDQINYLRKLEKLSPDAIILVTNRLAGPDENDERLIAHLTALIDALDPATRLGLYECPYPYKRLLSAPVIDFLVRTGRFDFIKDTCCQIDVIQARLAQIEGSTIRLYNANAATLFESLVLGAAGYSGIMLNFFPEIFLLLKRFMAGKDADTNWPPLQQHLRSAGDIASFITMASVFEYQKYPANAKCYLQMKGIIDHTTIRTGDGKPMNESQRKELAALANQAERLRSKVDVFNRRQLVFSAGKHFGSCHASSVLPLADGTVLLAYFAGTAEGKDDVGIWLSRQIGGQWFEPVRIAKLADVPHWNPVLFEIPDGVRLVFKTGRHIHSWQSHTMVSRDSGASWTDAVAYPDPDPACGPVRSKPIRLSNGDLLAPNSDESADAWRPRVDLSRDHGQHFVKLAAIPINTDRPDLPDYLSGKGAIQPTLWESQPGQVHMLLRTTSGHIFRSDSADYGRTWCRAYDTHLPSNNSGIEIAQDGQTLYLVLNPIAGNWASRNPLVIKRSLDNGRTFDHFLTLEHTEFDPERQTDAEFSYPSAAIRDRTLHVSYTYMRRQMAYARIPLDESAE